MLCLPAPSTFGFHRKRSRSRSSRSTRPRTRSSRSGSPVSGKSHLTTPSIGGALPSLQGRTCVPSSALKKAGKVTMNVEQGGRDSKQKKKQKELVTGKGGNKHKDMQSDEAEHEELLERCVRKPQRGKSAKRPLQGPKCLFLLAGRRRTPCRLSSRTPASCPCPSSRSRTSASGRYPVEYCIRSTPFGVPR